MIPETPESFRSLFQPLSAKRLEEMLDGLRYRNHRLEEPAAESDETKKAASDGLADATSTQ